MEKIPQVLRVEVRLLHIHTMQTLAYPVLLYRLGTCFTVILLTLLKSTTNFNLAYMHNFWSLSYAHS
jgi:hypothetical protein